jgi:hypothetical protein
MVHPFRQAATFFPVCIGHNEAANHTNTLRPITIIVSMFVAGIIRNLIAGIIVRHNSAANTINKRPGNVALITSTVHTVGEFQICVSCFPILSCLRIVSSNHEVKVGVVEGVTRDDREPTEGDAVRVAAGKRTG